MMPRVESGRRLGRCGSRQARAVFGVGLPEAANEEGGRESRHP